MMCHKFCEKVFFLMSVVILFFSSVVSVCAENNAMGHGGAVDVVVAKVNGVSINMSQLMGKMQEVTEQKYGSRGVSPLLANKIKTEATDKLIIEELAYQKAKAVVSVTSEMVDEHINGLKDKYGGEDGFSEYLKNEGLTLDSLRKTAERFLVVKLFVEQQIESKIVISDQEIIEAYQGSKGKYFMQKEAVQVNSIVFFLDPGDVKSKGEIAKIMQAIRDEAGNDPNQLPSDGTFIVQKDVKLDVVRDAKMFEIAKQLDEYAFSEPFEFNGTLYVLQLTGYKPEVVKTMEEVLPYLRRKITQKRRQALLSDWMGKLKNGADIEIVDLSM